MKKFIVITLVVLLATLAIAGPVLADSSEACDGLQNARFHAGKDSPAASVLEYQMKLHCSGGPAA